LIFKDEKNSQSPRSHPKGDRRSWMKAATDLRVERCFLGNVKRKAAATKWRQNG
jgi:hypothetical protein